MEAGRFTEVLVSLRYRKRRGKSELEETSVSLPLLELDKKCGKMCRDLWRRLTRWWCIPLHCLPLDGRPEVRNKIKIPINHPI